MKMKIFYKRILLILFWFFWISRLSAAELAFNPATPVVEVGKEIILSLSGYVSGHIEWAAVKGQIQGSGYRVTYIAPATAGLDVVTALDSAGNVGTLKMTVTLTETISKENANWEIFTNRSYIQALSEDGETLWVGTNGGLEQRDAESGELKAVLTNLDGLPGNSVRAFVNDGSEENGGLWIGTTNGLVHRHPDGSLEVFNTENSGLPSNSITSLIQEGTDGIWIGTFDGGLVHHYAGDKWDVFNQDNSELPNNQINSLLKDEYDGIWVGTGDFLGGGLSRRYDDGRWEIFNVDNSDLPDNGVMSLLPGDFDSIWIGTWYGGLAHRFGDDDWNIFNQENSGLPDNWVVSLFKDHHNGLWAGTSEGGLAHRSMTSDSDTWTVFNQAQSDIPHNRVNAILDDGQDGFWVGTGDFLGGGGLVHRHADGTWEILKQEHSGLPHNEVTAVLQDNSGGIWVGTSESGLAYHHADGSWETFNQAQSELPSDRITALLADGNGGIWVGTYEGGLAHRLADGNWENVDASRLPSSYVNSLSQDGFGGIWVGTDEGLVRHHIDGNWEVFKLEHPELPYNSVYALVEDSNGGVWMAVGNSALVYRHADGHLEVFNTDNSELPDNDVISLLTDGNGGIWAGTYEGGLAHRFADGSWEILTQDKTDLPAGRINSLISDNLDGLWVGTENGLAHLNSDKTWEIFNTDNSGLPTLWINKLLSDEKGGVWVGTAFGGLAHLTFGQKSNLCTQVNEEDCETLLSDRRAAILIHPRGQGRGYNQAYSIEFMATHAYRTLQSRGYDNDEIYFLSYKPNVDINGDGMVDRNVVDGPISAFDFVPGTAPRDLNRADIQQAFDWAKQKGQLGQPLLVIFVDHALVGKLRLDPFNEVLTAPDLGDILTDYQDATNNQVVVILEACHTGSLIKDGLSAPNRVIITSTDDNFAYYDNLGAFSFSKFYFDNLRRGEDFLTAFQMVTDKLPTYGHPFDRQVPQLDDDGDGQANTSNDGKLARKMCLNGCFGALSGEITLEAETLPTTVTAGQTLPLVVRAGITEGQIKRVWALVMTPEAAKQRNDQGFSLIPTPVINLSQQVDDTSRWQGSFSDFKYQGTYVITFLAEDEEGFITSSEPIRITQSEGPKVPTINTGVPPILEQTEYRDGDMFKVTLPPLPAEQSQYVGISLPPPEATIFVLSDKNDFTPFEGKTSLPVWKGGEVAMEVPIGAGIPRGEYILYLLRMPIGVEPLQNSEHWTLGISTFKVE